jgi:hypothetical protein
MNEVKQAMASTALPAARAAAVRTIVHSAAVG